jgi:hypothetical protein
MSARALRNIYIQGKKKERAVSSIFILFFRKAKLSQESLKADFYIGFIVQNWCCGHSRPWEYWGK